MKKIFLPILLLLVLMVSGCAKGEITLELSRWGAADVSCKLVAAPMLQGALTSFQDEFKNDDYNVVPAKMGDLSGFEARKHYSNVADIKDSKVLETFSFNKLKTAADKHEGKKDDPKSAPAEPAKKASTEKSMVRVQQGLLFDTVTVNTGLNLEPGGAKQSPEAKFLLDNVFKQMELKFIVKLPTAVDSSDATTVSADGKTLTWNLALGGATPINAQLTYMNPIKAASWAALVGISILGAILYRSYKKNRRQGEAQHDANTGSTK